MVYRVFTGGVYCDWRLSGLQMQHYLRHVRHVSFTYLSRGDKDDLNDDGEGDSVELRESGEIPALRDVSFTLEEGKRHAFVGESGAGKSTLVGLMLRAYDP